MSEAGKRPMTDYFALLEEPRRPWLEPDRIKETFHRLSRDWHPDQRPAEGADASERDFSVLNQAQQTLSEPKSRVRHLLALEYPDVAVSGPTAVPTALADLMFPVQGLLAESNGFLARKGATTSDLSRALLAGEGYVLQERVEVKLGELENQLFALIGELRRFDAERWDARPPDGPATLLGFYHGLAYLSRWIGQFREQLFQLAG